MKDYCICCCKAAKAVMYPYDFVFNALAYLVKSIYVFRQNIPGFKS